MSEDDERFNVVVWNRSGRYRYYAKDLKAKDAVEEAKKLVDLAGSLIGESITKVMLTDTDDFTVFLWKRSRGLGREGIVFPRWDEEKQEFTA